ncbi:MAG: hypothetical protein ACODAQ_07790 [Phycisphaeraceae bacterium]
MLGNLLYRSRHTRVHRAPLVALLGFMLATPTLAESPALELDFESVDTGQRPPDLAFMDDFAGDSVLRIVDADSDPADPFADGETNRSLYVLDASDEHQPRFAWQLDEPITDQGEFSIDVYFPEPDEQADTSPALLRIMIGQRRLDDAGEPSTVTDNGPSLYLLEDGRIKTRTPDRMWSFDQSFPTGQVHTLTVAFDVAQQTWTATIAGVPLTRSRGELESHPFHRTIERIDTVELSVGRPPHVGQHVFLDNLTLHGAKQ